MKDNNLLEQFYKDLLRKKMENVALWVVAGIFEVPLFILLVIPYQVISVEKIWFVMAAMCGTFGTMFYLMPYVRFSENQKQHSLLEKLRYVPLDLERVKRFRAKKMIFLQGKIFLVAFIGQVFFSTIVRKEFGWLNIGYVILFGFIWPLVSCVPYAYWGK